MNLAEDLIYDTYNYIQTRICSGIEVSEVSISLVGDNSIVRDSVDIHIIHIRQKMKFRRGHAG